MTLAVLHHLDEPFLGLAERPLRDAGVTLDERHLVHGDSLPDLAEVDGILSFGGSQSVRDIDSEPVLRDETRLLRQAADAGVPVLGVCLGGQLLAHALGAQVVRAPHRTVAWLELEATDTAAGDPIAGALGSPVRGLLWNEDQFDLPPGATELLTRNGDGVTAFRAGDRAWGVQFHPEVDAATLAGWIEHYDDDPDAVALGFDPVAARSLMDERIAAWNDLGRRLFASYLAVVG